MPRGVDIGGTLSKNLTEEKVRSWIEPWHDPHLDREYGLPSYDIAIRTLENGFEAKISMEDWRIKIDFDPGYTSTACQKLGFDPATQGDRVGADTAALLYLHEVAHWRCCPFDADGHGRILQGLTEGLVRMGANPSEDTIHKLSNIFSDVIVNVFRAVEDPDILVREMYKRAWMQVSRFLCQEKLVQIPPWGRIFISLQYRLMWSMDGDMSRMVDEMENQDCRVNLGNWNGVKWAVQQLIPIFRTDPSKKRLSLTNRDQWQEQARKFAEVIKLFLPPSQNEQQTQNGENSDNKNKSKEDRQDGEPQPSGIPSCSDNVFTKRFKEDAGYREEVIRSMLQRGATVGEISIAPRSVVLSCYYSERARQIVLRANDTGASPRLPIAHTGVRHLESGEPISPGRIRWSATRLYPGTDLQLFEKAHPITIQRPAEQMPGRLPDLLFALDSSGSMKWQFSSDARSRSYGDGNFDLALLAFFGIWHWLEATGCGPYLQYAAINFSNETISTQGWHTHFDSRAIWDVLLSYQGGGTSISVKSLRKLRDQHARLGDTAGSGVGNSFWMILLTDGKIRYAQRLASVLQEFMSEGHSITLVQLGNSTPFAEEMRGKGADVHIIKDHGDLIGIVLDRAKSVWQ